MFTVKSIKQMLSSKRESLIPAGKFVKKNITLIGKWVEADTICFKVFIIK